jgi:hypothetical protein
MGPRSSGIGASAASRLSSLVFSKSWLTDSFEWMNSMALASSPATERIVSASNLRDSGMWTVLVTTIPSRGASDSFSDALPESSACVAAAYTERAPRSLSATTALASVPPVSTMSSVSRQFLPSTSPTTVSTSDMLGPGRRLSMIAKVAPSRREYPRAILAAPTSGATTTRSRIPLSRKYFVITGAA